MTNNNVTAQIKKILFFLTVFAIAMGLLEAIVVVYLRQIYYPEGFSFPLNMMSPEATGIEMLRETSTIIMLVSISIIAGKNFLQRFSFFLLSFGVWDIFYYVWLKVLLNWPSSLLTWDILFLIPIAWVGPVLAPVICSVTMIILALYTVYFQQKGYPVRIFLHEWLLFISGAIIILCTFVWDFLEIIIQGGFIPNVWTLGTNKDFLEIISRYIPAYYNWYLFALGEMIILFALGLFYKRMRFASQN